MLRQLINPRFGVPNNSAALAGEIGEYIESEVLVGSSVSVPGAAAPVNVTSISLTAGDWDVWGTVHSNPASGTTTAQIRAWISSTSASAPTAPNAGAYVQVVNSFAANAFQCLSISPKRFLLSGTTTVYLSCLMVYGVSTMGAFGHIAARRAR
jgi:hypothetical protein